MRGERKGKEMGGQMGVCRGGGTWRWAQRGKAGGGW